MFQTYPRTIDPDEDLDANRQGCVSPAQVTAFQTRSNRHRPWSVASVLLAALTLFAFVASVGLGGAGTDPLGLVVVGGMIAVVTGALVGPSLLAMNRAARFARDLKDGRVESAYGQVSWKRGAYVAETDQRRLWPVFDDSVDLLPGRYRFYYLPESGGLLSAESSGLGDPSSGPAELLSGLTRSLYFTLEALDENRGGRMSFSQSLRLAVTAALYLLGALAAFGLAAALLWSDLHRAHPSDAILTVIFGEVLLVLIGIYVFWRGLLIAFDALSGKVSYEDGLLRKAVRHGRTTYYKYHLNSLTWNVSRRAYNALVQGPAYRVYYAPRSRSLLAVEPLR